MLLVRMDAAADGQCLDSSQYIGKMDAMCPKVCSEDGNGGLKKCDKAKGEEERTKESCGDKKCKDFLEEFSKESKAIAAGLAKCTGPLEGLKAASL